MLNGAISLFSFSKRKFKPIKPQFSQFFFIHLSGFVLQSLMAGHKEQLVRSLHEKISTLKNEYLRLKQENETLEERLTKQEVEFDNQKIALGELHIKYNALKLAKTLEGKDSEATKKRIDAMVKEIETCIELIEK